MIYKKQFPPDIFLKALSTEWKKTREIAEKVGCSRAFATRELLKIEEAEFRWVPGGKQGTREWRLKNESDVEKNRRTRRKGIDH